jgi:hypothetical protein
VTRFGSGREYRSLCPRLALSLLAIVDGLNQRHKTFERLMDEMQRAEKTISIESPVLTRLVE